MSKYSIQEFADIVESEGLDYTITSYLNPNDIEDYELREEALSAKISLEAIEKIIQPYLS